MTGGIPRFFVAVMWVVLLSIPSVANATRWQDLSDFERQTVERVLASRQLVVEPNPDGKTIQDMLIDTREVFEEEDGFVTILNVLHTTTQDEVLLREMLLKPGDVYDHARIADTERNLRNPFLRSIVVILPVQRQNAPSLDTVDLLVVTRDVWSLRANTNFQTTGSALNFLSMSLSENNLAGLNKGAALTFLLQQATMDFGARYEDPRLVGSRHTFIVDSAIILNRTSFEAEGAYGGFSFGVPLYSRDTRWGYSVGFAARQETFRDYVGTTIRTFDAPSTLEKEQLDRMYDWFGMSGSVIGQRAFGTDIRHVIRFGIGFSFSDPSLPDNFSAGKQATEDFRRYVMAKDEYSGYFLLGYDFFVHDYIELYDYDTFALSEEIRLGPSVSATATWASVALFRSDVNYLRLGGSVGYTFGIGDDALAYLSSGVSSRLEGSFGDTAISWSGGFVTPSWGGAGRLFGTTLGEYRFDNRRNAQVTLGGDSGLRGLQSRSLIGEHLLRANLEYRSTSFRLWVLRFGGVLFYDVGSAWDTGSDPQFFHTLGIGARVLILPLNRNVIRVDYGIPLNGDRVGFQHGVVTAGFEQAF